MTVVVSAIFRLRRDTAANWTSTNPILSLAEPGLETDTRKVKYGDGVTAWNSLAYSTSLLTSHTIGMSGDVTWSVSFDGSANVTAAGTIQPGAVTLAKMANMATASLLGRSTAGTGAPEVLSAPTVRTLLGLVIGTDVQAFDTDLTTWAGITPGAGVGTFLATPSSANLAAAVTGGTGTGALVFGTSPTLASPTITAGATVSQSTAGVTAFSASGQSGARIIVDSAGGNINLHDATESRFRDSTGATNLLRILTSVLICGKPLGLPSFTVATMPSASGGSGAGMMIYVSNESGGAVVAFSDGTNWRRVTDRAIVS